jgi:hypothetical protein
MEKPNEKLSPPENTPSADSGSKGYSSDESISNTNQHNNENDDPSTWPSGETSLEDLVKENESFNDTRIEGDNSNAGKGTTVGNP